MDIRLDGSNHYVFMVRHLTGSNDFIYLTRGQKYRFTNKSGGHPFRIQSTPNGLVEVHNITMV